jgi:drug/metabolite transporter (DMT)-like permease
MKIPFVWVAFFCLVQAVGQMLLKLGTNQLGHLAVKDLKSLAAMVLSIIKNPFIIGGMTLFVSSFFLWTYIVSWVKLGAVFPLTAMVFVFVAWMSYFALGESLSLTNYFGMLLIASGVYFLLR